MRGWGGMGVSLHGLTWRLFPTDPWPSCEHTKPMPGHLLFSAWKTVSPEAPGLTPSLHTDSCLEVSPVLRKLPLATVSKEPQHAVPPPSPSLSHLSFTARVRAGAALPGAAFRRLFSVFASNMQAGALLSGSQWTPLCLEYYYSN